MSEFVFEDTTTAKQLNMLVQLRLKSNANQMKRQNILKQIKGSLLGWFRRPLADSIDPEMTEFLYSPGSRATKCI